MKWQRCLTNIDAKVLLDVLARVRGRLAGIALALDLENEPGMSRG